MTRRLLETDGFVLEADVVGSGEPVLVIGTAVVADELLLLSRALAERGGVEVLHYRRRGYGRSSPHPSPRSITDDVADAAGAVDAWGVGPAHVVGASYSGAVALALAADVPEIVETLTVVEAPPAGTPHADEFREASRQLGARSREVGEQVALDEFMSVLSGDHWREELEQALPGSSARALLDASAFFGGDVPALLGWELDTGSAARLTAPTLCVRGADTSPWFAEMHDRLVAAIPAARGVVLAGADHSVATTHVAELADLVRGHVLHRRGRW